MKNVTSNTQCVFHHGDVNFLLVARGFFSKDALRISRERIADSGSTLQPMTERDKAALEVGV